MALKNKYGFRKKEKSRRNSKKRKRECLSELDTIDNRQMWWTLGLHFF